MKNKKIRWGIVGTGGIAHRFAEACKNSPCAELTSVASRSQKNADSFADEFGIENRFGSYLDMALSDKIDVAYIGVPHGVHAECAIMMMENGKDVLSEKPIAVNAKQLEEMISCAKKNDRFLAEAMWGRVVPGTKKLIEIVESGAIGNVRAVEGDFCYDMRDEPDHHAFKPEYGGGSLLDVGVYGLYFASWYIKSPVEKITAVADVGNKTHVDEHCCFLIKYKNGEIASLSSAMTLKKANKGIIYGDKGNIEVERFYAPQKIKVNLYSGKTKEYDTPYKGNGFEEQIREVSECIAAGKKESELLSLQKSLYIAKQMDEIRKAVGVVYPQD